MGRHPVHAPEAGDGYVAPRVKAAQHRHQIMNMLLAGATEAQCAEALGISLQKTKRMVAQILEVWRETDLAAVEAVRELQLKRIDSLVRTLYPKAVGMDPVSGDRKEPSLKAIAEIRKLEGLRARIAGTEAPKRIQVDGSLGFHLEPDEIERAEQAWLGEGAVDGTAVEVP
jgi:hypothetical protein